MEEELREEFYRRRLPHWQMPGAPVFLTWRLHGSPPPPQRALSPGRRFLLHDRVCDRAEIGPLWLGEPEVAAMFVTALHYGQEHLRRYLLHAWVIMPNHVHLLITPQAPFQQITRTLKGYTAYQANRILQRTGQPFWSEESFDHWIRSDYEFGRGAEYIKNNPVKAGFVRQAGLWPWSSATGSQPSQG